MRESALFQSGGFGCRCRIRGLLSFALLLLGAATHAADVVVSTLATAIDGDTTSVDALILNPGSDGEISIQEAIDATNQTAGHDTITFSVAGTIQINSGLITLNDAANAGVTLDGGGAVVLDGTGIKGIPVGGLVAASDNNIIKQLSIVNCADNGIVIAGNNNLVTACKIGTLGTSANPNGLNGIVVFSGDGNLIGAVESGGGNVVSGNLASGILVESGATNTVIQNNFIGLNALGTLAVPNSIGITNNGADTIIGGTNAGLRNIISGNTLDGILTSGSITIIHGNFIGSNAAGTAAVPNGGNGVHVTAGNVGIGGVDTEGNFISGNGNNGILFNAVNAAGSSILGNIIGLAPADLSPMGNDLNGVALAGGTENIQVGANNIKGAGLGLGNIIATNGAFGVLVSLSDNNFIMSNFIGTDDTASRTIGNSNHGIAIFDSANVHIGTDGPNVIHNNNGAGIFLDIAANSNIRISGNSIHNNLGVGILYQNPAPVSPPILLGSVPVFGFAEPNALIEIFADEGDEGRVFLGTTTADDSGRYIASVDTAGFENLKLTATATDGPGNTSPFSPPLPLSGIDSDGDGLSDDDEAGFSTNPNNPDTDGDGILDGREVLAGLDPTNPADAGNDLDGDGLTNKDELNDTLTKHDNADSDGDGMADGFEVIHRLFPLNGTDAAQDPDGDTLTNFDEHGLRSNPRDPNSPVASVFVSNSGIDSVGRGQQNTPFQTIGFALTQIESSVVSPARIVLAPGQYTENVVMEPGLIIAGTLGSVASIVGTLQGADAAQLFNVELRESALGKGIADQPRLTVSLDSTMTLRKVVFTGDPARTGTGIQYASSSAATLITECVFTSLNFGIIVDGAVPTVRKSIFDNIATNAILIAGAKSGGRKNLGTLGEPNTGFNTFGETGGPAVDNQTTDTIDMQNNDWGTEDPNEVDNRVNGPAVVEPFLAKGAGVLPASLVCTVWDAISLAPITNATVSLTGLIAFDTSTNTNGVYPIASLASGDYTVIVSAPGYDSIAPIPLNLADAQIGSVNVALIPGGTGVDSDNDGLTDEQENNVFGTDPNNPDTDSDGLNDDVEIAYGSDPKSVDFDRTTDINGDGTVNAVDVQLVINAALNIFIFGNGDIDRGGSVNATDVQFVILFALGAG